jgi:hypothetical protein
MHAQARISTLKLMLLFLENRILTGEQSTHIPLHLIMYLVAHATRKPPRTENLFIEEDNQTDSSITQFMQEEADQVITLLPTWHNFSANISRIVNRRHMPNNCLSHGSRPTYNPTEITEDAIDVTEMEVDSENLWPKMKRYSATKLFRYINAFCTGRWKWVHHVNDILIMPPLWYLLIGFIIVFLRETLFTKKWAQAVDMSHSLNLGGIEVIRNMEGNKFGSHGAGVVIRYSQRCSPHSGTGNENKGVIQINW